MTFLPDFAVRAVRVAIPRSPRHAFVVAAIAAAGLGILITSTSRWTGVGNRFGGRGHDGYVEIAQNLAAGAGYVFHPGGPPVIHRPPLYAFALTPIMLFPEPWQQPLTILLNSCLLGLTSAVCFQVAGRYFGSKTASGAALLLVVNPWLLWMCKNPMSIVLQTTLFAWLFSLVLPFAAALRRPNEPGDQRSPPDDNLAWSRFLLLGLACGFLCLTHGAMLLTTAAIIGLLFLYAVFKRRPREARRFVAAGIVALAVISPWTARNWNAFGLFMPVTGNAGLAYYYGNIHWGIGAPTRDVEISGYDQLVLDELGIIRSPEDAIQFWGFIHIDDDQLANRKMSQSILENPYLLAKKCVANAAEFYFPVVHDLFVAYKNDQSIMRDGLFRNAIRTCRSLLYLAIWLAAIAGIARHWPKIGAGWVPIVMIVAYIGPFLPFLVFVGHSQYVAPTLPMLAILASSAFFKKKAVAPNAESRKTPEHVAVPN